MSPLMAKVRAAVRRQMRAMYPDQNDVDLDEATNMAVHRALREGYLELDEDGRANLTTKGRFYAERRRRSMESEENQDV